MKLLIVTQTVDVNDPILGFFVRWIESLAMKYEEVVVICLKEGEHQLPSNIRVYSLGKEKTTHSRYVYAFNFIKLTWKLRSDYEAVFVHMNQEYILLAGWLWKILRKHIYMWRNHYAGSWLTDAAAGFCTKVFCTSKQSYTAKYKKTELMPVGVDLERFTTDAAEESQRVMRSILFLARISPSKRPDMLVKSLGILKKKGIAFAATIIGSPTPDDERYYQSLKDQASSLGLDESIIFKPGIPNGETPKVYRRHEIFVNCSPSGMFDKTLFEAAASGCLVLAASDDFRDIAGNNSFASDAESLADKLMGLLAQDSESVLDSRSKLEALARGQSLIVLVNRLQSLMC